MGGLRKSLGDVQKKVVHFYAFKSEREQLLNLRYSPNKLVSLIASGRGWRWKRH
jgi:hypothetical protein